MEWSIFVSDLECQILPLAIYSKLLLTSVKLMQRLMLALHKQQRTSQVGLLQFLQSGLLRPILLDYLMQIILNKVQRLLHLEVMLWQSVEQTHMSSQEYH